MDSKETSSEFSQSNSTLTDDDNENINTNIATPIYSSDVKCPKVIQREQDSPVPSRQNNNNGLFAKTKRILSNIIPGRHILKFVAVCFALSCAVYFCQNSLPGAFASQTVDQDPSPSNQCTVTTCTQDGDHASLPYCIDNNEINNSSCNSNTSLNLDQQNCDPIKWKCSSENVKNLLIDPNSKVECNDIDSSSNNCNQPRQPVMLDQSDKLKSSINIVRVNRKGLSPTNGLKAFIDNDQPGWEKVKDVQILNVNNHPHGIGKLIYNENCPSSQGKNTVGNNNQCEEIKESTPNNENHQDKHVPKQTLNSIKSPLSHPKSYNTRGRVSEKSRLDNGKWNWWNPFTWNSKAPSPSSLPSSPSPPSPSPTYIKPKSDPLPTPKAVGRLVKVPQNPHVDPSKIPRFQLLEIYNPKNGEQYVRGFQFKYTEDSLHYPSCVAKFGIGKKTDKSVAQCIMERSTVNIRSEEKLRDTTIEYNFKPLICEDADFDEKDPQPTLTRCLNGETKRI